MRRFVSAVAIGGIALAAVAVTNGATTHAGELAASAPALQNPLVLTNPATGAQAQIMPTTQYLTQHGIPYGPKTGSTGSTSTTTTTTGPCTLANDSSPDDAHVLVNNADTQFNSLDLSSVALQSDASSITGQVTVENLSDGNPAGTPAVPAVAGGGDVWYVVWNYGNAPGIKGYFLEATYPGVPTDAGYTNNASTNNLPVDFKYGTITTSATGGSQFTSGGAASGVFDLAHNRIAITAPLSAVGSPATGATLSGTYSEADAILGTSASGGLLETADKLDSAVGDYQVGQSGSNCPVAAQASASQGALPTQGSTKNLAYFGGPVVHAIKNYAIWWLPKTGTTTYSNGSSCTEPGVASYSYEQPVSGTASVGALPGGSAGDAGYQAIILQYFKDLSGTSFYNLLTQYADLESGATPNNQSLGSTWTDNCGYTSTISSTTGPVPGGTEAAPIYQTDIQAEVQRAIAVNHWPDGMGNQYFVFTGYGAADCFAPATTAGGAPTCSVAGPNPGYCAYHGDFQDASGNYVLYADMADGAFAANPTSVNLCYTAPIGVTDPSHTVNGQQVTDPIADTEVSITSHEQFETVTDAQVGTAQQYAPPLAWYDEVAGEIGDKCAYIYGNYAQDGSNVTLHGDHYIVQQEYSNWDNGCALTDYQGNGGYGGASATVAIQKGWNVVSVPVSGITSSAQLLSNMEAAGSLPAGAITEMQTYTNGKYQTYYPGKKAIALARTNGVLVYSTIAGAWHPTGTLYTSAPTISLSQGWNLVAATYPNPGLMTDAIYNQIEAETGACSAAILTNAACSPTITEIRTTGAAGATIDWKPTASDANGNATWPQTYGNQIPFTSGMWIYSTKALNWTVQGNQCQSVDTNGVCQ